jgi:phage baseplate assembly protein W
MNPEFGCDLNNALFEQITSDINVLIQDLIRSNVEIFIPEIQLTEILVEQDTSQNQNTISVTVKYKLRISQTPDQVTVQFI